MKIKTILDWTALIAAIVVSIYIILQATAWRANNLTVGAIPAKEMLDFVGGLILLYLLHKSISKEENEREQRRIIKDTVGEVIDERKT